MTRKGSEMRATPRLLLSLAALLIAGASAPSARADGALPATATPVQREQAQSRFLRGKDLMNKKDHDGALSEFRASHDIVASPNTRLEIARCLQTMGKLVEAYAEFGRTAVEAKELKAEDNRYQRAYDAAITERAQLQPMLGFVSLTVENPAEGTRVTVGGEEIRRAAWAEPAPVMAGTTAVVVRTAGHAPVERTVTLAAGATATLTIDAQSGEPDSAAAPATAEAPVVQSPSDRSPLRTWAYVAGGVGAAGLATFAIFGAMARSTYGDLQGSCGDAPCPANKVDEVSSGKGQQTIANLGLAVGLLGAAGGATLFVLSLKKDAPATGSALVVAPAWIGVRGSL
jgi:hypothetical protein